MSFRLTLRCTLSALLLGSTLAAHANISVDQILEQVRDRDDGHNSFSKTTLILQDDSGSERQRELIYLQKDQNKDSWMTLYFTGPSDVRGVGLQSVNYEETLNQNDDQWMYLPAFRQIRRIAADDKRGAFMGSQYAYIDLDRLRVSDYQNQQLADETWQNYDCYVVERTPINQDIINKTGYHKTVVWVDKATDIVVKQTYYDEKGVLFKTMEVTQMQQIQGIWTVMESKMTHHVKNKHSILRFSDVRYNVELDDNFFKQSILRRGINASNLPLLRQ